MASFDSGTVRVHSSGTGFTIVNNSIFRDRHLTLAAKGLLCTMLSLPADWDFSVKGLQTIVNPQDEEGKRKTLYGQGRDAIKNYLRELEREGYLIRTQERNEQGVYERMVFHVFDTKQERVVQDMTFPSSEPVTDSPSPDSPSPDEPLPVNPSPNKDSNLGNKSSFPNPPEAVTGNGATKSNEGNGGEEGDGDPGSMETVQGAFFALCERSLKAVSAGEVDMAFAAYRKLIEAGHLPEEISRAYERYIKRYWESDETRTSNRYALRLHVWLQRPDGFERDVLLLAQEAQAVKRFERTEEDSSDDAIRDEEIRSWLLEHDEAYAEAVKERSAAETEITAYPLANGFGEETIAYMQDPENPLNKTIQEMRQRMDRIFLARKTEALAALRNA